MHTCVYLLRVHMTKNTYMYKIHICLCKYTPGLTRCIFTRGCIFAHVQMNFYIYAIAFTCPKIHPGANYTYMYNIHPVCKSAHVNRALENVFGQSPLVGPQGSGLDQNCTCTTRPWGQQNVTINMYLQYLITEEIKEQDIVYIQTDGRPDGERVSHKLDWSSTSRTKNCIHSNSTLILQKAHIFAFSCSPSKTVCVKS